MNEIAVAMRFTVILIFCFLCGLNLLLTRASTGMRVKRIVGGEQADPLLYPWHVSIHCKNCATHGTRLHDENLYFLCNGVLTSHDSIITTGDCVAKYSAENLFVLPNFGVSAELSNNETQKYFNVSAIRVHPAYRPLEGPFNLAGLKLGESTKPLSVKHNHYYRPAEWFSGKLEPINYNVIIIGHGSRSSGNPEIPSKLSQLRAKTQASNLCKSEFNSSKIFRAGRMGCAIVNSFEKQSVCYGDDGGGVVLYHENASSTQLLGIAVTLGKCDYSKPILFLKPDANIVKEPFRC